MISIYLLSIFILFIFKLYISAGSILFTVNARNNTHLIKCTNACKIKICH